MGGPPSLEGKPWWGSGWASPACYSNRGLPQLTGRKDPHQAWAALTQGPRGGHSSPTATGRGKLARAQNPGARCARGSNAEAAVRLAVGPLPPWPFLIIILKHF
jgi:hypothetical protein